MIGRLNHVAIAVPDAAAASVVYRDSLGATVSAPIALPEHGVRVVFVELPNSRIELIEPLGENSPIAKFLGQHPQGALHHLCFEVGDLAAARDQLNARRHACAWRRRAKNRGAWQAGCVFEPEGLRRNSDRTRTGVKRRTCHVPEEFRGNRSRQVFKPEMGLTASPNFSNPSRS